MHYICTTNPYDMSRKRSMIVILHFLIWLLVILFPLIPPLHHRAIDREFVILHSINVSMMLVCFYSNYWLFVDRFLFEKKFTKFISINILMILAFALTNHICVGIIADKEHGNIPFGLNLVMILRNSLSLLLTLGICIGAKMSIKWLETEKERERIEKLKAECELQNLKNQMNPHFLINTLNNIYALVGISQEKAQDAIQQLSKLLRYVLRVDGHNLVPLVQETDFLKSYIELMKLRQGNNVTIEQNIEINDRTDKMIAPLIHISLIENAFKHGINSGEKSKIVINIRETDEGISTLIKNTYFPKDKTDKSGSGIGLQQVEKRLKLQYPSKYDYEHKIENGYYIVKLDIKV